MTFVSKHGRRMSKVDTYRDVPMQRWKQCLATAVLLMHFCGFLVLADSPPPMTSQMPDRPTKRPFKVPLPQTDLISSVQQVSASAKECQQQQARLNATMPQDIEQSRLNVTTRVIASAQPHCSQIQPFHNTDSRNSIHQCLQLGELSADKACDPRYRNQVHLRFCSQYHLGHILPQGENCGPKFLTQVKEMDKAARLLACQFDKLLELYDCDASYSVSWSCKACKRVYKQWVCAMVLPFHLDGQLVKPCRSVCRLVEQMCPYFHPSVKEQYAGERVFKCIDPDIPDLESISPHSVFGLPGDCYCAHYLDAVTARLDPDSTECELSRQVLRPTTTTNISHLELSSNSNSNSSRTAKRAVNRTATSGSVVCSKLRWPILIIVTLQLSRTSGLLPSDPT